MVPFAQVQAAVLELAQPLSVTEMPAVDAVGLVLAEDVLAEGPVPSFVNSAMDGFAVRAADTAAGPVELRVIGRSGAGSTDSGTMRIGELDAVRIMTGAPVPPGADAVVMVESTSPGSTADFVRVNVAVAPGTALRHPGEDVTAGSVVLRRGTALGPVHVGLAAIAGRASVRVYRRPVVGVLSTGDELCNPPAPLGPARIRDANRPALLALVAADGATAIDLGIVADRDDDLDAAIADAAARCDLLLTSGGVSMGDRDLMKARLTSVQVAIKPAKPLAYGRLGGISVLALPGNPVSAVVSYALFGRPLIRRLLGHDDRNLLPRRRRARLITGIARQPDGKLHLVRVTTSQEADGLELLARPLAKQASHQLAAMADSDALALVPDGDGVTAGEVVEIIDT